MKLELSKYRKIKETLEYIKVRDEMLEAGELDFQKVSLLCATSSLNIIAVYSFLGEDCPIWFDICESKIKSLKEFYGYEEIC